MQLTAVLTNSDRNETNAAKIVPLLGPPFSPQCRAGNGSLHTHCHTELQTHTAHTTCTITHTFVRHRKYQIIFIGPESDHWLPLPLTH